MTLIGQYTLDDSIFNGIAGRAFIYPCAGEDWDKPLAVFADWFDEFHFVDLHYQFLHPSPIKSSRWTLLPASTALDGPSDDAIRDVETVNGFHRDISPAWLRETYACQQSGRTIRITRRRGFGQYALRELSDESLGVFFHRGDSTGEGGSNTWFLDNWKARHPPLGCLFDKIKRKLAYPALIVSDGSNTHIRQLRMASQASDSNFQTGSVGSTFDCFGLHWQQVGEIGVSPRGRTIIWRVEPV
jgi:hypothetical protein